jgi:hypothetical protein
MVVEAIEAKRSLPRPVRPRPQRASMEERYVEGVRDDIEDMAAVRATGAVLAQIRLKFPGASEEDVQAAIEAANALHVSGLLIESEYGDNQDAVKELEKQLPGYSHRLYKNIIAYFGNINH